MPLRKAKVASSPIVTPPSTSDPLFSSVGLLCPFRESFVDRSTYARSLSSQGVSMSADTAKFGSQSAKFGSQTFLSFGNGGDLTLAADFLIEAWVFQTARPTEFSPILECLNGTGYSFGLRNGRVNFYDYSMDHTGNTVIPLNEWHHIAAWRRNGILSFWIDGVPDFARENTRNITASGNFRIGSNSWSFVPTFWFTGYLQDLRLTKASRSPILPTQPFPTS